MFGVEKNLSRPITTNSTRTVDQIHLSTRITGIGSTTNHRTQKSFHERRHACITVRMFGVTDRIERKQYCDSNRYRTIDRYNRRFNYQSIIVILSLSLCYNNRFIHMIIIIMEDIICPNYHPFCCDNSPEIRQCRNLKFSESDKANLITKFS